MEISQMSLSELFSLMEKRLKEHPETVTDFNAIYQFDLSGKEEATYQLHLKEGAAKVVEGEAEPADCQIQMSSEDFKELLAGKLNATSAFMFGKLKIKGNMGLAMKLQSLLGKINK